MSDCLDEVSDWMRSNWLQLKTSKTEIGLLWCSTSRRRHLLPTTAVRIGVDYVSPSSAVRDSGIMIDSDVSMRLHVSRTLSGCFAVLRQMRSTRRSVSVYLYCLMQLLYTCSLIDGESTMTWPRSRRVSRLPLFQ